MMPLPEPKLKGLYQEVILDHNRNPRNYREIHEATQYSRGHNPLCGDDYHVYLKTTPEGVIEDAGFLGKGCAISKASASMMTTLIKGKKSRDVEELKNHFLLLMTKENVDLETRGKVDRLIIFEGVKEFPIRVKCATLAWHALADALKDARA